MVKLNESLTLEKSEPQELIKQDQNQPKRQDKLQSMFPQRSRQFVGEVNPLCGQRRSLLAQIGSSNNQVTLKRKFLIVKDQDAIRGLP